MPVDAERTRYILFQLSNSTGIGTITLGEKDNLCHSQKHFISLTIEWHNWGLCCGDDMVVEKTTVKKAAGTIHIVQSNGRREIVFDELIPANPEKLLELFDSIDRILDTGEWSPDYSVDVCDGYMWNLYIRRGKSKMIKIHGTVEPGTIPSFV